jgi:hypothetical protein
MRKFLIFLLLLIRGTSAICQDISKQYEFIQSNKNDIIFKYDDVILIVDHQSLDTKPKKKNIYLYSYKGANKIDSLLLPQRRESALLTKKELISNGDEIFFCLNRPQRLIKVDRKTGKLSPSATFNQDSVSIDGVVDSKFISQVKYIISIYDVLGEKMKDVFGFVENADEIFKDDIGTEHPIGIDRVFTFATSDKILVKTGYNESDASFECIYYLVNTSTSVIEKLPSTYFEPLVAEPREKLKFLSDFDYKQLDFKADIRKMYFDVFDSIGYVPYHFSYHETINPNRIESKWFKQDAFVINKNFEIIGRALERNINIAYPIYEKGKKVWNVISSNTDSLKGCFFKIDLNYQLEKAFYNLYHNNPLSENLVRGFDKYELSLLRNLIFAKHNYKFNNPLYQAYFNTFAFYSDEPKRNSRLKNVDKMLTNIDKNNLASIAKVVKEKTRKQ